MSNADFESALLTKVRNVVLDEWDPIGIRQFSSANDEYDHYIPEICGFLMRGALEQELFNHLWWLETEHMGLTGDEQRTSRFAHRLMQLKDAIRSGE